MKYRKKPVVIQAFKWTGGIEQLEDPEWIVEEIKKGNVTFDGTPITMKIKTLES